MTDRLDIVSIGIEYKSTVIIRMIVHAKAGSSVVPPTRSERGAVERIHRRPIFCDDRDMHWLLQPTFAPNPKVGFAAAAKASGWLPGLLSRRLHDQRIAKRRQGLFIESLGTRIVGNRKSHVIDHGALHARALVMSRR